MKHVIDGDGAPICGTKMRGVIEVSYQAHRPHLLPLLKDEVRARIRKETDCKRCKKMIPLSRAECEAAKVAREAAEAEWEAAKAAEPKPVLPFNEFMLRVSWSTSRHSDGQTAHCRRGEVMLDLGLSFAAGDDFTQEEMQAVASAAKVAALKALRARRRR